VIIKPKLVVAPFVRVPLFFRGFILLEYADFFLQLDSNELGFTSSIAKINQELAIYGTSRSRPNIGYRKQEMERT
jgi:hypothetical protein